MDLTAPEQGNEMQEVVLHTQGGEGNDVESSAFSKWHTLIGYYFDFPILYSSAT